MIVFHGAGFQIHVPNQCRDIIGNANNHNQHVTIFINLIYGFLISSESVASLVRMLPLVLFVWSVSSGISLTCDQILVIKRTEGPQLYEEQRTQALHSGNLNLCSRWCIERENCEAVSWESGYCAQVGPSDIRGAVNMPVYLVPKNRAILGKYFYAFITFMTSSVAVAIKFSM